MRAREQSGRGNVRYARTMFQRSSAHRSGYLCAPDGQTTYWEEHGSPDGLPALYLHGGPGGGLGKRGWTQLFDPALWRLIGFDQRGCGRSAPRATDPAHNHESNTTMQLIADIEQLREELGIDEWVIYGVSWGTALALAYARSYPQRVRALVLMAVATTSPRYVEWITEGVKLIYPETWTELADAVGYSPTSHSASSHSGSPDAAHPAQPRLIDVVASGVVDADPAVRERTINAWLRWEDAHISIGSGGRKAARINDAARDMATLAPQYWARGGFFTSAEFPPLEDDLGAAATIPAAIVHGRLDVSGPAWFAWKIHQMMPNSSLTVVEDEGHGGEKMVAAAAAALAELATSLR